MRAPWCAAAGLLPADQEKITEQDNNYGWSWVALQLDDIDVQITAR